ncbi:hypothetical protein A2110_00690 [Candidatus Jorgensenbacteria bacterium GWA1_54_12]|uniref:UDP-N-acetylglucosamine--N-acetylmuramyl-(pentapeptide) pyrophosphoryl-undecaprenol N-acetylglucosamine transferase n=1 Tax=Candidatus Jorgensenbacteria bacterium GWA1_54_12 TaxID=1798468 RepID=A0A1F6BL58_9BACT|nr:MAG: hypothetical protein A2110_00690 [Candidatus Jorgensenbacteria bacterium GWA1_54_12]
MAKRKKVILVCAGGTGGHVYPALAVAEELLSMSGGDANVRFIGPRTHLADEFHYRGIRTYRIAGAKFRRYFSLYNFVDIPKLFFSFLQALVKLFIIMPDIVFSKGGPGTLPVVLAARFYRIPVVIHETDSVPSLNTRLAARFAARIGVSWKSTASYFPKQKTFLSGNPVRKDLFQNVPPRAEARKHFGFEDPSAGETREPVILILGGSQGAAPINNFFANHAKKILANCALIHQAGEGNLEEVKKETRGVSEERYRLYGTLKTEELKNAYAAADIIVSRAGGALFEIAAFGKPAILIPLPNSANNHQYMNAYEYAGSERGDMRAIVIEEPNLTLGIFLAQVQNILDPARYRAMEDAARAFAKPNAARLVAEEVLKLA